MTSNRIAPVITSTTARLRWWGLLALLWLLHAGVASAQAPATLSGQTVNLTITGDPTPHSIEFAASTFTLRANGSFSQSGTYSYNTLSGTQGQAVLTTTAPVDDAGDVDTITLIFATATSGTFVDNYVWNDSTAGSYSGIFSLVSENPPVLALQVDGGQLRLGFDLKTTGGLFYLLHATNIAELLSRPTLLQTGDAPLGGVGQTLITPSNQPAGFYKLMHYPGLTSADLDSSIEDDLVETPPTVFFDAVTLPEPLPANQAFSIEIHTQDAARNLVPLTGSISFALENADGTPATIAYTVSPPQLSVANGIASGTLTITTADSLAGAFLAVSFTAPLSPAIRMLQPSNTGSGVPVAAATGSSSRRVGRKQPKPLSDYQSPDGTFWTHPLKQATRITGNFGEWPGHQGNVRVHAGVDFGAPAGTTVFAAKKGIVTWKGSETIVVDHGNGFATRYIHVSPATQLSLEDVVQEGDALGTLRSMAGSHLHFELIQKPSPLVGYLRGDAFPGPRVNPINRAGNLVFSPSLDGSDTSGPRIPALFIRNLNPGRNALSLEPTQPIEPGSTITGTAYVIVQAVDEESGNVLVPDLVTFSPEGGSLTQVDFEQGESSVGAYLQNATLPGYARLPVDELTQRVFRNRRYKFWFPWETAAYLPDPVGPRSFTAACTDVASKQAATTLLFGPMIQSIPASLDVDTNGFTLNFTVDGYAGPFPNALAAGMTLDRLACEIACPQRGSDWEIDFIGGQTATRTEWDLTSHGQRNPLALRIRPLKGTNSADGLVTITATSRLLPNIRHQVLLQLGAKPGKGSVLDSEFIVRYSWPSSQRDLDTGTTFLGAKVGFSWGSSAPYTAWTGDNTSSGGTETVTIDIAAAAAASALPSNFTVDCAAGWFAPAGGSGPATIEVFLRNKGTGMVSGRITQSISPGRQSGGASTPVGRINATYDSVSGILSWTFSQN